MQTFMYSGCMTTYTKLCRWYFEENQIVTTAEGRRTLAVGSVLLLEWNNLHKRDTWQCLGTPKATINSITFSSRAWTTTCHCPNDHGSQLWGQSYHLFRPRPVWKYVERNWDAERRGPSLSSYLDYSSLPRQQKTSDFTFTSNYLNNFNQCIRITSYLHLEGYLNNQSLPRHW